MTETTFNGNLCIGTSYDELSDKNKDEYKPEHWKFADKFPDGITEVKGNIAIFNQLPTIPKDLKIAGPVVFHNIEFKETDDLPFKKTASCIDFYDCYGILDLGGIDICGHLLIRGNADEKLKVRISEPAKIGTDFGFEANNITRTVLKNLTAKNIHLMSGMTHHIFPTVNAERYYIGNKEYSTLDEIYQERPGARPPEFKTQRG